MSNVKILPVLVLALAVVGLAGDAIGQDKATPQEVVDNVPPEYMVDDKQLFAKGFENSRRCLSQTGEISDEGAKTVSDVLNAFDPTIAAAKIDLKSTYDNSFAEKAAKEVQ